jgi:FkbM family methyltransferase
MYNPTLKRIVIYWFRKFFLHRCLYPVHKGLFRLSLHGMGILNYESAKFTGERNFLERILARSRHEPVVIFDVGANDGTYSTMVKAIAPNALVYAFEPHPRAHEALEAKGKVKGFFSINAACGNAEGTKKLFDYADRTYSAHASLSKRVFTDIHGRDPISYPVQVVMLDNFVKENPEIEKIKLLKTDTEGCDFHVLLGARGLITEHRIDFIQFEFNEMNVVNKVFFKDFVDLLTEHSFYRLLPDGPVAMGNYFPISHELFAFQNIVAVRKDLGIQF